MARVFTFAIAIPIRRQLPWFCRFSVLCNGVRELQIRLIPSYKMAGVLLALLAFVMAGRAVWAEPARMPHPPILRGFGGLCDGGPLTCTRIDEIAFTAGADAIVLPSTSLRSLGFVASYGLSVGILQHVEGGIFSHTSVWGQPSQSGSNQTDTLWQQGPMRFALKGLVWPFTKKPHERLAVLLDFEYEARLPHFDGANQLGFLTDLAALRGMGNLPLGLAEIGLSVGALFEPAGSYVTPEVGARVGFHLPFMPDTKVFAEGIARGVGVWRKARDPAQDSVAAPPPRIVPSGALAFGLITRPRRQVDFAMVVHVGFGDVAPFFLTLRGPLDFSIGEGYPYPHSLVVDILREAAEWIAEQTRKLPEPLQQTCILYGRDGQPIASMGRLTDNGEQCEFQGRRFRIGDMFYPDPVHRRVCLDPDATRCVGPEPAVVASRMASENDATSGTPASERPGRESSLGAGSSAERLDPAVLQRLINQGALGPIRGKLDERCILNEASHQVSPIGHISADGKYCVIERDVRDKKTGKKLRTQVQQISIGQPVYRDPNTGRVCMTRNTKSQQDCPAAIDVAHNRPLSSGTEIGYHGALAIADWANDKMATAEKGAQLLTHPAELTTAALKAKDRAEQAAKGAVETLKDPNKAQQAAHEAWESTIDAAHGGWQKAVDWYNLPLQKKLDGAAEGAVKGGLDFGATAVLGAVIPGGGSGLAVGKELERATLEGKQAGHILEQAATTKKPVELPPRRGNGGRGGGPDHAKVQAQLKKAVGGDDEVPVDLTNGRKRIVDVQGADGRIYQVGDMRSSGGTLRPSARERGAIEDLRKAQPDADIEFRDKRGQHPPLVNPDKQPDWKPAPGKHRKDPD